MKNNTDLKGSYLINKQKIKTDINQDLIPLDLSLKHPALDLLTAEGGESFYNYIEWLGLASDPGLVVLSSMHHYYYDTDDLRNTQTVVNLLPLNQINNVKGFFHSIYHLIPHKCYFIGCFTDYRKEYVSLFKKDPVDEHSEAVDQGIISRIPFLNFLFKLVDRKTNRFISGKNVALYLEDLGLKVLDMTELNGKTYFCTRKVQSVNNGASAH